MGDYTAEMVGADEAGSAAQALEDAKVYVDEQLSNIDFTETDPTVPAWAKAASKPSYTASEVGAAPSSHNHSASNITSGTLPVARGGTGATTAAAALTALGAAASSHNHAASNITSGTLGVVRGGTGVTSNPSMLTNLASTVAASVFAASPRPGVTGILPVTNGGTGVSSLAALATAMGVAKIQVGYYVGTNTFGASSPCSLTFSFAPKVVGLLNHTIYTVSTGKNVIQSNGNINEFIHMDMITTEYDNCGFNDNLNSKKSADGKTLYWYNATSKEKQYNSGSIDGSKEYRYYWIAIG